MLGWLYDCCRGCCEMQVAEVVKWVCGKQCGAAVNALKQGTGALVCEVDIHKLRVGTITYMGALLAKFLFEL